MNERLPSEEQLAQLEERVLQRIRRRRRAPVAVGSALALAALVAGGIAVVHPTTGAGTSAGSGAGGSSATVVICHRGPGPDSPAVHRVVPGGVTARAAIDTCLAALTSSPAPTAPAGQQTDAGHRVPVTRQHLVACRGSAGRIQVFVVTEADPARCRENGMKPA